MVGRFFEPDDKICIIIDNVNYKRLRRIPGYNSSDYQDFPLARVWADEFEEGIKAFGFSPEQIQRYKDCDDWYSMDRAISSTRKKIH